MNFELNKSVEILERTPHTLRTLLQGLDTDWTAANEGDKTWSPYDVVGHLIHGEDTDWIPRAKIILNKESRPFEPFDRFAQFNRSAGKSLEELLKEFELKRAQNLNALRHFNLQPTDLELEGTHPELGKVTLRQLLSAWVVHDLGHIAQVSRVMAKQYASEVGVWTAYMRILQQ